MFFRHALLLGLYITWGSRLFGHDPSAIDKRTQIERLRAEIAYHDERYHRAADPEISDAEYDRLRDELQRLTRVTGGSPDVAIGDDRSGRFPLRNHALPLLSLEKARAPAELEKFLDRIHRELGTRDVDLVLEPKVDGLALNLTYVGGKLMTMVTRGNGVEGDDLTDSLRVLELVPGRLKRTAGEASVPERVEIRGELHVPWSEFHALNEQRKASGLMPFATPRSAAVGLARDEDASPQVRRALRFVAYGSGAWEPVASRPATQRETLSRFRSWGVNPVAGVPLRSSELPERLTTGTGWSSPPDLPVDGWVLKVNRVAEQEILGRGASAPRWAVALKFVPEERASRLLGVTWQVGRTGVLTPVAELAPVMLNGTTVRRASLHSLATFERLGLHVDDQVLVRKSGDVIPQVLRADVSKRAVGSVPLPVPETCPACEQPLDPTGPPAGVLRCSHEGCWAQRCRQLEKYAGREAMNIAGLGPATIEALVRGGQALTPADLYRVDEAAWRRVPGVGTKRAAVLWQAIDASRSAEPWRVLLGVGFNGVGPVRARELMSAHGSLAAVLAAADGGDPALQDPGAILRLRELEALGVGSARED